MPGLGAGAAGHNSGRSPTRQARRRARPRRRPSVSRIERPSLLQRHALQAGPLRSARDSECPASLAASAGRPCRASRSLCLRWPRTVLGGRRHRELETWRRGRRMHRNWLGALEEALARQWLVATGHAPTPLRHCPSPVRPTRHLAKAHSAPTHRKPTSHHAVKKVIRIGSYVLTAITPSHNGR